MWLNRVSLKMWGCGTPTVSMLGALLFAQFAHGDAERLCNECHSRRDRHSGDVRGRGPSSKSFSESLADWSGYRGCVNTTAENEPCLRWDEVELAMCNTSAPCDLIGQQCDAEGQPFTCCAADRAEVNCVGGCWFPNGMLPHLAGCTEQQLYTSKTHPKEGLQGSFCRNPEGAERFPWCYYATPLLQPARHIDDPSLPYDPVRYQAKVVGRPVCRGDCRSDNDCETGLVCSGALEGDDGEVAVGCIAASNDTGKGGLCTGDCSRVCYDPQLPMMSAVSHRTAQMILRKRRCGFQEAPLKCGGPCEGGEFAFRSCECGVELHQRLHGPPSDGREESKRAPPFSPDVCFINDHVSSSYCAATPVATFPYTAWHRSEPSGMIAAVTWGPGTKFRKETSFNLGFLERYGESVIDTTLGGTGSACAEAFREFLCFTVQPRCKYFVGEGEGMRVCGVCQSVCARYVAACAEDDREILNSLAWSVLSGSDGRDEGLCILDDEGYRYDTDFLKRALKDFFFPNCTRDYADVDCTSADSDTCSQSAVPPSAIFSAFEIQDNHIVNELESETSMAKLIVHGNVTREITNMTSLGQNPRSVLMVPPGSANRVQLFPGLPVGALLSNRVDQFTLVVDYFFEAIERYPGESLERPPSGACLRSDLRDDLRNNKGLETWEGTIKGMRKPSSCILFNPDDKDDLTYCPLLGVLGGCVKSTSLFYQETAKCGVKFTVGHVPTKSVVYTSILGLKQHGQSLDGPNGTWTRVVLSVDLISGYVRGFANTGQGASIIMNEDWLAGTVNFETMRREYDDAELSKNYLKRGGVLALSENITVASDCNSASRLGSLALFPAAMAERELSILAGAPFSPLTFAVEVVSPRYVELIEGRSIDVAVRLLHQPPRGLSLSLRCDRVTSRVRVRDWVHFSRDDWRKIKRFNIKALDDHQVQLETSNVLLFRVSSPNSTILWPLGLNGLIEVRIVDDDEASLIADYSVLGNAIAGFGDNNDSTAFERQGIVQMRRKHNFKPLPWCEENYICIEETTNLEEDDVNLYFTGNSLAYELTLGSEPINKVVVEVAISSIALNQINDMEPMVEASPSNIIFDPLSWRETQVVTLTFAGSRDALVSQDPTYRLHHTVRSRDDKVYNGEEVLRANLHFISEQMSAGQGLTGYVSLGHNEISAICAAALVLLLCCICSGRHERKRSAAKITAIELEGKFRLDREVAKADLLKSKLMEATKLVEQVMNDGGSIIDAYELQICDLGFDDPPRIIGAGSFGTVCKATLRNSHEVAVKRLRVGKVSVAELTKFKSEIIIMAPLRHENLVRLWGGVWNEGADNLCIVVEYCSYGALNHFLGKSEEMLTWANGRYEIALGIAKGLAYLHHDLRDPLIHRDVKPDNIMVCKDSSKAWRLWRIYQVRYRESSNRRSKCGCIGNDNGRNEEILCAGG